MGEENSLDFGDGHDVIAEPFHEIIHNWLVDGLDMDNLTNLRQMAAIFQEISRGLGDHDEGIRPLIGEGLL